MRILVISDNHNRIASLEAALDDRPEAKHVIYLGDGLRSLEEIVPQYPDRTFHMVAGNCDFGFNPVTESLIELYGQRIFFTHGHNHSVKTSLSLLIAAAKAGRANIALYGHTHIAYTGYENGLYIMNPGSIACSHNSANSYGYIDITDAGIVTNIVRI